MSRQAGRQAGRSHQEALMIGHIDHRSVRGREVLPALDLSDDDEWKSEGK